MQKSKKTRALHESAHGTPWEGRWDGGGELHYTAKHHLVGNLNCPSRRCLGCLDWGTLGDWRQFLRTRVLSHCAWSGAIGSDARRLVVQ